MLEVAAFRASTCDFGLWGNVFSYLDERNCYPWYLKRQNAGIVASGREILSFCVSKALFGESTSILDTDDFLLED